jgi:ABC-2 type transport system permease protein
MLSKMAGQNWRPTMRNYWLVAKHEYLRMVIRRGFVLITLAIPVAIAAFIALIVFIETSGEDNRPIGYVDKAGFLEESLQAELPEPEKRIQVQAFPNETEATTALEGDEIQAFFVFPPSYPESLETDLYYLEEPPDNQAWREFDDFVRINLVSDLPADSQTRLLNGTNITVQDIASNREFSEDSVINVILPIVVSFFFVIATMSAAGYMLRVVADEKENRTMEIVITSVTPNQLIIGKSIGLLAAALTQLAIYVLAAILAIRIASGFIPELQQATVPWDYMAIIFIFFFPAYALISAFMVAIGSSVTEVQQGQQIAGLLNLLFLVPLFALPIIISSPDSPLVQFMTFFPTTSFLTISLRWGIGTIPMWQLIISWIILVASALFMIWAAARIFQVGMLRYGQPLSFAGAISAVRGKIG